jgi:peptide deformylase
MIWERLEEYTVNNPNCLGMAGVQVGLPYRAFYLKLPELGEFRFRNPIVKEVSVSKSLFKNEGCMSFPGVFIDTLRADWIDVYDDINGLRRYSGLLGICVQHEMEHLNGETMFQNRAPSDYKKVKVGRNDPCPECLAAGKKKVPKFKKCLLHYM